MTDQQIFPPPTQSAQDSPASSQVQSDDQQVPMPPNVPGTDPQVDELVQAADDLQQDLSQPVPADDQAQPVATAADPAGAAKSPLDILEELLGKSEQPAANEPPKPTPEEIAAVRQAAEEQQAKELELQRQHMLAEIETDEQKKRDEVRQQQMGSLQANSEYHIPQLQRKTIQVPEEQTATKS